MIIYYYPLSTGSSKSNVFERLLTDKVIIVQRLTASGSYGS
jgi:hypothetical protein